MNAPDVLIKHVVAEAVEYGDYEQTGPYDDWEPDEGTFHPGDVDEWDARFIDDVMELEGRTTGKASVKVVSARYNPPSMAHPAEYETRDMHVVYIIRADWSDDPLGEYIIRAECDMA